MRLPGDCLLALSVFASASCASAPASPPAPVAESAAPAPTSAPPHRVPPSAHAVADEARVVIDGALREGALERWQQRRALVFTDGTAVFALDDAWALLAQAPRPRRAALYASLAGALDARAALDGEERARVAAAAQAAHLDVAELYAHRAGLDGRALRGLVDAVLASTGALLGPVAGDVTLLPDVLAAPAWRTRHSAARPAGALDPASEWALFYGLVPRPPTPDDAAAWGRALTVELRLSALSVQALLATPAPTRGELDALASRALADDAEPLPGASALLDVEARGAAVERFIGLLRAPSVARDLWSGSPVDAVVRRLLAAPPADQEGYPEAFVAVVRALPDSL